MSSFICNLQVPRPNLLICRQLHVDKIRSRGLPFTNNKVLRWNHFSINCRFLLPPPKSAINGYGISVPSSSEEREEGHGEAEFDIVDKLRGLLGNLRSILPGGSWWSLSEEAEARISVEPVTVTRALGRMWDLVARDRWIIYSAFSVLVIAALSEISIPHFLTATIFSAESGKISVFRRNVQLLMLLCVTSGICRSKSLVFEVTVLELPT